MSKRRKWLTRAVSAGIALGLVIGLIGAGFVGADPAKESKWDDVSTPSETDSVILPDSDILDFDVGPDGDTIYAVALVPEDGDHPEGCALFKSEDGGVTWDDITDEVVEEGLEAFYLVAVAPDDEDYVVVAGSNDVVGSNDGGDDFSDTSFGDSGILCVDVSPESDGKYNVALGTDGGKIYRYESGGYWGGSWKDATTYAGWSSSTCVTSVAFSPNFAGDDTVLAITGAASGTYQQAGLWGTTKAWNASAGSPFTAAVKIVDAPPLGPFGHTGIALPEDFVGYDSGLRYSWVYVNYDVDLSASAPADAKAAFDEIGEVFRIKGKTVDYAGICCERYKTTRSYPVMASIATTGEIDDGNLMVGLAAPTGCCEGIQVYRTSDWPIDLCCPQWSSASKVPTGLSNCLVAYAPDGKTGYASTAGTPWDDQSPDESAFSVSTEEEVGKYWNQVGLIDTNIDAITDAAVNPPCGTIWLFSINDDGCGCDSVWSSTDDGASYMRVWCADLAGSPEVGLIRPAPEEEEISTVYLVDQGTKSLYWNDDSGITDWTKRTVATLDDIMDLAVEAEDTIYAVDSDADVAMSDKRGAPGSWSAAEDAKLAAGEGGHTIVAVDGHVLVGGDKGSVSYSDDSADSFSRLGEKGELGSSGLVHVAFDSYFKTNDTVYAAVTDGDQGVWRWVVDDSTSWKDLKATAQDYYGIVLDRDNPMTDASNGGVLYAVYDGGVARWLSPCGDPKANKWDYLENGLGTESFTAEPSALKICGDPMLWAINTDAYDLDEGELNLFVYDDCLSKAGVDLSKVADGSMIPADACYCYNQHFILEWDELCNSSTYELTIALDKDFDYPVTGKLSGIKYDGYDVDDESIVIPEGDLTCNQDYYWRVRVIKADSDNETIRSWWSKGWEFTIEAGGAGVIGTSAPEDGATGVALKGVVFTWSSVSGATGYDWTLMDASGAELEAKTGLSTTSYVSTSTLKYDTAYTWKVKAMKDGKALSGSSIATFRTMMEPEEAQPPVVVKEYPPAQPVPAKTPFWVWVVIAIGAILVIVVIVLIFRTRRV
jgi:hypothetical protein